MCQQSDMQAFCGKQDKKKANNKNGPILLQNVYPSFLDSKCTDTLICLTPCPKERKYKKEV